jgi:hypothetical protein
LLVLLANGRMDMSVGKTATAVGTVERSWGIHMAGSLKRS